MKFARGRGRASFRAFPRVTPSSGPEADIGSAGLSQRFRLSFFGAGIMSRAPPDFKTKRYREGQEGLAQAAPRVWLGLDSPNESGTARDPQRQRGRRGRRA